VHHHDKAIIGATSLPGIHVVAELCKRDMAVRVIARRVDQLDRARTAAGRFRLHEADPL
jgi:hypothetical protein